MESFIEKIIDTETGETLIREYSEAEIADVIEARKKAEIESAEMENKIAEKLSILSKLGLTDDEAKLLFG